MACLPTQTTRRWLVLIMVIGAVAVGSGVALAAEDKPGSDVLQVGTSYNGSTPAQRITVTLQIRAQEATLSDIRIKTASMPRTVIQPSSYTTTVAPGNRNVAVKSPADGTFRIGELTPPEQVKITFQVVPTTLKFAQIDAARMRISYIKHGQQVRVTRTATASMTDNPWLRLQHAQQRNAALASQLQRRKAIFIGGFAVGIIGMLVAGVGEYRRRSQLADRRAEMKNQLAEAYTALSPADRPVIERIARNLGIELDGPAGPPSDDVRPAEVDRDDRSQESDMVGQAPIEDAQSQTTGEGSPESAEHNENAGDDAQEWDPDRLV